MDGVVARPVDRCRPRCAPPRPQLLRTSGHRTAARQQSSVTLGVG